MKTKVRKPQSIPVFIVLAAKKVVRVTHDPVDAERYRVAFTEPPNPHWHPVEIVRRSATL